jgi:hypothetical protein
MKVIGMFFESMAYRLWSFFQKDWTSGFMFVVAFVLFAPTTLIVSSLLGWTSATLLMLFATLTMFSGIKIGGQVIAAGVGKAVDIVDRDSTNDAENASRWANKVGELGVLYTLLWAALTFVWKPGSDPGAFIMAFTVWVTAHQFLKRKGTDGAKRWQDRLENLFITLLLTCLASLLYTRFVAKTWKLIIDKNIVALTHDWGLALQRDFTILGQLGSHRILGPILLPIIFIFILGVIGFISLHTVKKSAESVAGVSRNVIQKTLVFTLAVTGLLIVGFLLMGALSNGGGGNSVALPNLGSVTGIHPISFLVGLLGALFAGLILWKGLTGLFKGFTVGRAALTIIGLIVVIWYVTDVLPTFIGHRRSDRITQMAPKVHQDQGELLKLSIYPKERSWGESMSGALVEGDAVDSFLVTDGTEIYVEKVVGWTESNFGLYLADENFNGKPFIHPCRDDSLLQTPQAWASWFPATRCPGPDSVVVQTPILVLRKPGGELFVPKGVPLISGKTYVVHGGPYIPVGTIQWCSNGRIDGHYEVTLRLSRPAQPTASATALSPIRGRSLPDRPLFVFAHLCYTLFAENLLLLTYCTIRIKT